ncbi:AAA domain-containing protein [Phlyctochytrium arcticum]|nr:AAA domain-containing protein [Phlyctochytrium arcticum]
MLGCVVRPGSAISAATTRRSSCRVLASRQLLHTSRSHTCRATLPQTHAGMTFPRVVGGPGAAGSAERRVRQLMQQVNSSTRTMSTAAAKLDSSETSIPSPEMDAERVCIGDVCVPLARSSAIHKVPMTGHLDLDRQDVLAHLQWMMRKDRLGQDMFLIGPPGPLKRHLALTYLHLVNREHEYVALHRDTSAESDLKQRREIVRETTRPGGSLTAHWVDGVAVKAAVEGRVLVIEGIEKTERNVLPVLNNLLENREMNLEDGRHIVHHARYDALLKQHSKKELSAWRLVRASEHFRVIALGVPVPPYPGNPLDPPFRSRFQVRYIESPFDGSDARVRVDEQSAAASPETIADANEILQKLRDLMQTIKYTYEIKDQLTISDNEASNAALLPQFSQTAVGSLIDLLSYFPEERRNLGNALLRVWPSAWVGNALNSEQAQAFHTLAGNSKLPINIQVGPHAARRSAYDLSAITPSTVTFKSGAGSTQLPIEMGSAPASSLATEETRGFGQFVHTPRYQDVVSRMAQAHALGSDMCLVGPKGSGKTTAIMRFAALFGYEVEVVHMYRDMTARDLLQRRGTRTDGSTFWESSALVRAAIEGKVAVLDGLHWVRAGTISSLQRLVQDREAFLPDGTFLTSARNYDALREQSGLSVEELTARGVIRVHPAFRVIATGTVHLHHKAPKQDMAWLTEEIASMFQFLEVGAMDIEEEAALLRVLTRCPEAAARQLLDFAARFRALAEGGGSGHETILAKSASLSTRQVLRICRRMAEFPEESLYTAIHRTCLSAFLPHLARQALEDVLADANIAPPTKLIEYTIDIKPQHVRLGDVTLPKYSIRPDDLEAGALIPHTAENGPGFFDNPVHTRVMREIAVDFVLGEHLLLIGNQGVGKNRLTDRVLELIGRPREYIQLHRDTTVQSLTVQPVVENGNISYKDSPLVRAARKGRVLVVDEADKAPVYITSILKSLAETGEMSLADGRRIRPAPRNQNDRPADHSRDIYLHPDFRMIVLANRPGYPFLGNDFFTAIGEVFSCHAVENPDVASEHSLLCQSAPELDPQVLYNLVLAFGDLRKAFDDGLVNYPYSLRELMNLVKHMREFPDEPLDQVLRNVFDFDVHRKEFFDVLMTALRKHGLNVSAVGIQAVKKGRGGGGTGFESKQLEVKWEKGKSKMPPAPTAPTHGEVDGKSHVGGGKFAGGSGGSNTAGIGGRGGPYRLHKAGNPIVRLPDDIKNDVPDHIKQAAQQMGREALERRLKEIQMSSYEAGVYKDIYDNVRQEIMQLKVILEGVQAKEKERTWLPNQTDGEFDEAKIIEGLTGSSAIYKRRGDETPEHGSIAKKPKRLKFVFDVSASMYSYNEHDGRLNRSLETCLMIMESLSKLGDKYVYDIVGHSGDSDCIPFVLPTKPPTDEMGRLKVLQAMSAHSQYCFSGDTTLKAAERAVKEVAETDADDYFTLIMSDANLQRYGIRPEALAKILEKDPKVNAAVLFIGSFGSEARMLTRSMPPGKAFVALNTSDIPKIMKEIFTAIA